MGGARTSPDTTRASQAPLPLPGKTAELPLRVVRVKGLHGPVTVELVAEAGQAGTSAEAVVIATDQERATLTLRFAGDLRRVDGIGAGLSRSELEVRGASVVLLRRPPELRACEAFGNIAALDVMRALKLRFDPKQVLNPGRFVGGL